MTLCFPGTFWDVAFCLWSLMLKKGAADSHNSLVVSKNQVSLYFGCCPSWKKDHGNGTKSPNSQIDTAFF
jgi:hypothetical protein